MKNGNVDEKCLSPHDQYLYQKNDQKIINDLRSEFSHRFYPFLSLPEEEQKNHFLETVLEYKQRANKVLQTLHLSTSKNLLKKTLFFIDTFLMNKQCDIDIFRSLLDKRFQKRKIENENSEVEEIDKESEQEAFDFEGQTRTDLIFELLDSLEVDFSKVKYHRAKDLPKMEYNDLYSIIRIPQLKKIIFVSDDPHERDVFIVHNACDADMQINSKIQWMQRENITFFNDEDIGSNWQDTFYRAFNFPNRLFPRSKIAFLGKCPEVHIDEFIRAYLFFDKNPRDFKNIPDEKLTPDDLYERRINRKAEKFRIAYHRWKNQEKWEDSSVMLEQFKKLEQAEFDFGISQKEREISFAEFCNLYFGKYHAHPSGFSHTLMSKLTPKQQEMQRVYNKSKTLRFCKNIRERAIKAGKYDPNHNYKITDEQIQKLTRLGFQWNTNDYNGNGQKKQVLVKIS